MLQAPGDARPEPLLTPEEARVSDAALATGGDGGGSGGEVR
jgi:hypothetical protein